MSDTEPMRRVALNADPALLVEQLAGLFEAARPTRIRAGHVRVDGYEAARLVRAINKATGSSIRRDWRGRVTVSATSPLATIANEAREAVEHCRKVPLSDDIVMPYARAAQLAIALRRATA